MSTEETKGHSDAARLAEELRRIRAGIRQIRERLRPTAEEDVLRMLDALAAE